MIGKASEIKTTGPLRGIDGIDNFLMNHQTFVILQVMISPGDIDYFYIIYKEPTL